MCGIWISAGKLKSVHKAWLKERAPTEPVKKDDEDDIQNSSSEHDDEDPEATDNDDAGGSDSALNFRSSSEVVADLGDVEIVDEDLLPDAGTSARASIGCWLPCIVQAQAEAIPGVASQCQAACKEGKEGRHS